MVRWKGAAQFYYDTDVMPEGVHWVYATGADAAGHAANVVAWRVYVDRTAPVVDISGAAYEARNQPDVSGKQSLSVRASDHSSTHSTSGVVSIQTTVDGHFVSGAPSASRSCTGGGCSLGATGALDFSALPPGPHVVDVRVDDAAGNVSETDWTVFTGALHTLEHAAAPAAPQPTRTVDSCWTGGTASTMPYPNQLDLGARFDSLSLSDVSQLCAPDPRAVAQANSDAVPASVPYTSIDYGFCQPSDPQADNGCADPLSIQAWPECARNESSYSLPSGSDGSDQTMPYDTVPLGQLSARLLPRVRSSLARAAVTVPDSLAPAQSLQLAQLPAASYEDGTRIEIYAGGTTFVVYAGDPGLAGLAATALAMRLVTNGASALSGMKLAANAMGAGSCASVTSTAALAKAAALRRQGFPQPPPSLASRLAAVRAADQGVAKRPATCASCFHRIGLDQFYTHRASDCQGGQIDPVNVVWWPKSATSGAFAFSGSDSVASTLYQNSEHNGSETWSYEDQLYGVVDTQGLLNTSQQCKTEAVDEATNVPVAIERNHVRLFDTHGATWYVVGDAHHDATDANCGHYSADFLGPKREIYRDWPTPKHFDDYGNNMLIRQCGGAEPAVGNNGWVAVMQNGTGSAAADVGTGPASSALPTISVPGGTPNVGVTLTGGTGGWTGSPNFEYAYQWNGCSGTTCTPIAGATASTYAPTVADSGHTLTLTVTASNDLGSASATSAATAAVVNPSHPWVFYPDSAKGNTIDAWFWTSFAGWTQMPLYGDAVASGTSPVAATFFGGAQPNLLYVDPAYGNTIDDWTWTSSAGWTQLHFYGDPVTSGSSPAVTSFFSGSQPNVVYADAAYGNTIDDWTWTSSAGWTQLHFYGDPVASGSSPAATSFFGGSQPNVVYVDAAYGNTIDDWTWTSSAGWTQLHFYGDPVAAGTSPATAELFGNQPNVFYVDSAKGNTIDDWTWTPSTGWTQTFFYGDPVAAGTSPTVSIIGGQPNVYYVDAAKSNTIDDWQWNPGTGWTQVFFYGDSATAGTSPASLP